MKRRSRASAGSGPGGASSRSIGDWRIVVSPVSRWHMLGACIGTVNSRTALDGAHDSRLSIVGQQTRNAHPVHHKLARNIYRFVRRFACEPMRVSSNCFLTAEPYQPGSRRASARDLKLARRTGVVRPAACRLPLDGGMRRGAHQCLFGASTSASQQRADRVHHALAHHSDQAPRQHLHGGDRRRGSDLLSDAATQRVRVSGAVDQFPGCAS
jgi:hypothetical protein